MLAFIFVSRGIHKLKECFFLFVKYYCLWWFLWFWNINLQVRMVDLRNFISVSCRVMSFRVAVNGIVSPGRPYQAPAAYEYRCEDCRRAPFVPSPSCEYCACSFWKRFLRQPRVLSQGLRFFPCNICFPARWA